MKDNKGTCDTKFLQIWIDEECQLLMKVFIQKTNKSFSFNSAGYSEEVSESSEKKAIEKFTELVISDFKYHIQKGEIYTLLHNWAIRKFYTFKDAKLTEEMLFCLNRYKAILLRDIEFEKISVVSKKPLKHAEFTAKILMTYEWIELDS